jgi:hypothetical protein
MACGLLDRMLPPCSVTQRLSRVVRSRLTGQGQRQARDSLIRFRILIQRYKQEAKFDILHSTFLVLHSLEAVESSSQRACHRTSETAGIVEGQNNTCALITIHVWPVLSSIFSPPGIISVVAGDSGNRTLPVVNRQE